MKIIGLILLFTLGSCASKKYSKCPAYGYVKKTKIGIS